MYEFNSQHPQWSIRNVTPEARSMVREVMETSGISAGEAVTEAILLWYAALPEADDDEGETFGS